MLSVFSTKNKFFICILFSYCENISRTFNAPTKPIPKGIHYSGVSVDRCSLTPLRANIGRGIMGFYGLPIVGYGLMLMLLYPPVYLTGLLVFSEGIMW